MASRVLKRLASTSPEQSWETSELLAFPDSSISPKMHLLEDHIIPWAKEWHVGFGLLGEQGAESIHARVHIHATKDLPSYAR